MDRFERHYFFSKLRVGHHLHSNMDRFERKAGFATRRLLTWIYIPIWIDLKGYGQYKSRYAETHLHSNMDRFERKAGFATRRLLTWIYIPIWIDLKVAKLQRGLSRKTIYIPIWIDLKGQQPIR